MNHPDLIISRIRDLLRLSGVESEEMIEEMTDHYLTHIETLTAAGASHQVAIREVYQTIATMDIKPTQSGSSKPYTRILLCVAIIISAVLYVLAPTYKSNIANSERTLLPVANADVSAVHNTPTGWPLDITQNEISSGFGLRYHPILGCQKLHKGIDIKAKIGTPVLSTGSGSVITAGYDKRYGNYIIISHSSEYASKYTHLQCIDVVENQLVWMGDQIGTVGTSGISTAPHLHYELLRNEQAMDPMEVVSP